MLSKMMPNQVQSTSSSRNTSVEGRKGRPIASCRADIVGEEKRRKVNVKPIAGTARCASGSNWEKYKDLVTEQESKDKNKNQVRQPWPFQRYRDHKKLEHQPPTNILVRTSGNEAKENEKTPKREKMVTKQIAMDCEMVGIGNGTESMIARVSIVNKHGECIYDKYVKPRETVLDYRTPVSGIRPHHLRTGENFETVQKEVDELLKGRILVGHALKNDLSVLFLSHPKRSLRDTSRYKPFRKVSKGNTPSLKKLAAELLGVDIQSGEHNSVEDARTAMQLYMLYKNQWEMEIHTKR